MLTIEDKNRAKLILIGLKQAIDKEIANGNNPTFAIAYYQEKLAKYIQDFKHFHDQEVKEIAKEFGGEVVKN